MASTTTPAPASKSRTSSHSRTRSGTFPSRPTTPLRPPSRTSLRASQTTTPKDGSTNESARNQDHPLNALEPAFAELSDSMADLEANFMHLQLLNESLGRFNENFGAFLYGMNMSAFCVDFPEAPIPPSFSRHKDTPTQPMDSPFRDRRSHHQDPNVPDAVDATFLTTDTSFVENPPTSSKPASKFSEPPASAMSSRKSMAPGGAGRGASARGRAGSGIGRGGVGRGGTATGRGGSGINRGTSTGTGTNTRGRGWVR